MSFLNALRYIRANPLMIAATAVVLGFLWIGAWRERSLFCALVGSMASIGAFFVIITDYSHQKMAWGTTLSPASLLAQKRAAIRISFDQHRKSVLVNSQAMSYAPASRISPESDPASFLHQRWRDRANPYMTAQP